MIPSSISWDDIMIYYFRLQTLFLIRFNNFDGTYCAHEILSLLSNGFSLMRKIFFNNHKKFPSKSYHHIHFDNFTLNLWIFECTHRDMNLCSSGEFWKVSTQSMRLQCEYFMDSLGHERESEGEEKYYELSMNFWTLHKYSQWLQAGRS